MSGRLSPIRTRTFLTLHVEAITGGYFARYPAGDRDDYSDTAYDRIGFRLTLFL